MPARDLRRLLAELGPHLRAGEYVFVTAGPASVPEAEILASVVEPEGCSFVLARADADRHSLAYDFVAAWITLTVNSALDAVGLTAAVATALAEAGIPCNMIAGHHHDHVLVPAGRASEALEILEALGR